MVGIRQISLIRFFSLPLKTNSCSIFSAFCFALFFTPRLGVLYDCRRYVCYFNCLNKGTYSVGCPSLCVENLQNKSEKMRTKGEKNLTHELYNFNKRLGNVPLF